MPKSNKGKNKQEKIKIDPSCPHLVLCEGADAYYFLIWFLDDIKNKEPQFSFFKVYDFGGIDELKNYISALSKEDNFDIVKSITIIRDAETNALAACSSIKNSLQKVGLSVPETPCTPCNDTNSQYPDIVTGFLLFPTCSTSLEDGTLEDLCLKILSKKDAPLILDDVDKSLELYRNRLPRFHKNRLHVFFSFTDEYVSLKIGEAAQHKAFSYTSPEMTNLKYFLEEILKVSIQSYPSKQ